MSSPFAVPKLIEAKKQGRLAPLVGAGLSLGSDVGGNFPPWPALPGRLLDACDDGPLVWNDDKDRETLRERILHRGHTTLAELLVDLDLIKDKLGVHYRDALTAIFRPPDAAPGAAHRAVLGLGTRLVLTTNYDRLLEDAESPSRPAYTWKQADQALADIRSGRRALFKVHGTAEDETSVVLTASEYARAHADPRYAKVMDHVLLDHALLFVGYGMADPNDLDLFLADHAAQLRSSASIHYALLKPLTDPQQDADRRGRLRAMRIAVVAIRDHDEIVPFLDGLAAA